MKAWKKLSEKTIHRNDYWEYKIDKFSIGNYDGEYHYVSTDGSTMVVPVLENNKFILVKQYRYLNRRTSIEFPAGGNQFPDNPEKNAIKELREETGYDAKVLIPLAQFNPFNGVTNEICFAYIAKELVNSPLQKDSTEDFEILNLTEKEIDDMIATNEIWDGMTVATWYYYKLKKNLI